MELSLQYLCDRLAEKNQLNKTLFVITGDHIPYMLSSEEQRHLAQLQNLPYDSVLGAYKNTAIIYSASIKNPIQCENFCCNVDLLPTVLNLLGFDLDYRTFFGTDILGNGLHRARIYNGNFITDKVMYRRSDSTAIWFDSSKNMSEEEKEYYLENLINYTEAEYEMSLALIETDFWAKIGLQGKMPGNPIK